MAKTVEPLEVGVAGDQGDEAVRRGLRDVIGADRAETLMSATPLYDLDEVATKADVAQLPAELRAEMADLRTELKADWRAPG